MFQFPRFASPGLCIHPGDDRALPRPGFPIRKSRDQRLRAAPPGLSQLATSFIAGLYQGIHLAPLLLDPLSALGVATRRESRSDDRSARSETSHRSETLHLSAPTMHTTTRSLTPSCQKADFRRFRLAEPIMVALEAYTVNIRKVPERPGSGAATGSGSLP